MTNNDVITQRCPGGAAHPREEGSDAAAERDQRGAARGPAEAAGRGHARPARGLHEDCRLSDVTRLDIVMIVCYAHFYTLIYY